MPPPTARPTLAGASPDQQENGPSPAVAPTGGEARRLALLTLVALAALVAGFGLEHAGAAPAMYIAVYLVAYAAGGYSGAKQGWAAMRSGHINVDVLMLLAAAGAAAIGAWLEGGVLLFLFSLSEALQSFAMRRTETALTALMDLRPDMARMRHADGAVAEVPVEDVRTGDVVLVRPTERIPVDGAVVDGTTEVDESPITGESLPVLKEPGDEVLAATINGSGAIELRATRPAAESTVARIIALVSEARAAKAPTQRYIDTFGERYAWGVILMSAGTLVVTAGLLGWAFDEAFYRSMTLLVVASPCALVISTPASYLSAIANAARHGILLKGGAHLEAAALIDSAALDKTGTLTTGRPVVSDVVALDGGGSDEVLRLASAVERHSEHLIAQAVCRAAAAKGLEPHRASGARAMPGLGMRAVVGGRQVVVSSPRLQRADGRLPPDLDATVRQLEAGGKTTMVVSVDESPRGVIAVSDSVRPEAKASVATLRRYGFNRVVMLTGDNTRVASAVAIEVGIDAADVRADLMPEEKVRHVEDLAQRGHVAFVGDGANDAPALAAAHLGVAMGGSGTDVALETADVVLMGDRLDRLVHIFGLGRAARRVVKQNVAISVGVMVVLVLATLGWGIPLPLGVVGHEGSTVIVVLNGLRLLRYAPRLGAAGAAEVLRERRIPAPAQPQSGVMGGSSTS